MYWILYKTISLHMILYIPSPIENAFHILRPLSVKWKLYISDMEGMLLLLDTTSTMLTEETTLTLISFFFSLSIAYKLSL